MALPGDLGLYRGCWYRVGAGSSGGRAAVVVDAGLDRVRGAVQGHIGPEQGGQAAKGRPRGSSAARPQ